MLGPDLHPPKPHDWSLRTWCDFDRLTPDEQFPPGANETCGPLSVPFLEPAHPLMGLELDVNGIWLHILTSVDLAIVDIQLLATRVTSSVRSYGYGPVVLKSDLVDLCMGMRLKLLKEHRQLIHQTCHDLLCNYLVYVRKIIRSHTPLACKHGRPC